jgi:hypothetical protein
VPEAGFFGIVIQIQAQAGGNLSEALGNLSRVLRDRKKMKAKVQALSMEAKASAAIIGALPFIVAFLVYLSSPLHHAAVHHEHRPHHPRRLRRLDVDRHLRDAQDDQLRSVRRPMTDQVVKAVTDPTFLIALLVGGRGLRDHLTAAAGARRQLR